MTETTQEFIISVIDKVDDIINEINDRPDNEAGLFITVQELAQQIRDELEVLADEE